MENPRSGNILLYTLETITNNDLEKLSILLKKFPIENLGVEKSNTLLVSLLNQCAAYNREKAAKLVFARWEEDYSGIKMSSREGETYSSQRIDFFSTLFKIATFDEKTYAFLAKIFEEYSFLSVMADLCLDEDNDNLIRTLDTIFNAYGEQTPERLKTILEEADSRGNATIYNYIYDKLLPYSQEVEKPEWLKNFRETIPTNEELQEEADIILDKTANEKLILPDENTLLDHLTDGMANSGLSFENVEEARLALRGIISNLTEEDIRIFGIDKVLQVGNLGALQSNKTLFRILGPSNPQIGAKAEDFLDAQDRMFTCSLFDYDDEDETFQPWFNGYCYICSGKLPQYWYAIRIPRSQGGWTGCYCGFECARKDLYNEEIPKLIDGAMLDIVERKIKEIGIQDRI